MYDVPILYIIFNRLDTVKRVFPKICEKQPKQLFIACDGPRLDRNGESEKVREVRDWVLKNVTWECELKTSFQEMNLGCKRNVISAISWFFSHVEYGLIIEDDCLPNDSFFDFEKSMLEMYKDDNRIMMVGGCNNQTEKKFGNADYFFWRYNSTWGWGTWKRAWKLYDEKMTSWRDLKESQIMNYLFPNEEERATWIQQFDTVAFSDFDTWDWQWKYTMLINNGLCILPNYNFIKNIGTDENATHTIGGNFDYPYDELDIMNITHPTVVMPQLDAEIYGYLKTEKKNYRFSVIKSLIKRKPLSILYKLIYGRNC